MAPILRFADTLVQLAGDMGVQRESHLYVAVAPDTPRYRSVDTTHPLTQH